MKPTPAAAAAVLAIHNALTAVGAAMDFAPWVEDVRPNGSINVRFSYDLIAQVQLALGMAAQPSAGVKPSEGR